jgi:hypothetical protein
MSNLDIANRFIKSEMVRSVNGSGAADKGWNEVFEDIEESLDAANHTGLEATNLKDNSFAGGAFEDGAFTADKIATDAVIGYQNIADGAVLNQALTGTGVYYTGKFSLTPATTEGPLRIITPAPGITNTNTLRVGFGSVALSLPCTLNGAYMTKTGTVLLSTSLITDPALNVAAKYTIMLQLHLNGQISEAEETLFGATQPVTTAVGTTSFGYRFDYFSDLSNNRSITAYLIWVAIGQKTISI